ncbi:MAG: hypothetical protein V5783_10365 [Pontiella sp.]
MRKLHPKKSGFVLASILAVIMVLSLSFGAFMFSGSQQSFTTRRMINHTKAQAYAEAGIEYSFAKLSADFTLRDNLSVFGLDGQSSTNAFGAMESTYGDGSFAITLTPISNRYCIVTSVGKCRGQEFTAEIVTEDYNADTGGSTPPVDYTGTEGFEYPILCGGTLTFNGDVTIAGSNNKIHTNSDADYTNKIATENENTVTASGSFSKSTPVCGKEDQPVVSIPDIDLTPWENEAIANGMVIQVCGTIPDPIIGGVLLVNGSGTFEINDAINATVIVTDADVKIKALYQPGTKYALGIVAKEGNVCVNGNKGILGGITYVPNGNFTANGTTEIHGQIIVGGTTTFGGTPDAFVCENSVPTPPGTDGTTTPYVQDVRISAWQR